MLTTVDAMQFDRNPLMDFVKLHGRKPFPSGKQRRKWSPFGAQSMPECMANTRHWMELVSAWSSTPDTQRLVNATKGALRKLEAQDREKYPWLTYSDFYDIDKDYTFVPGINNNPAGPVASGTKETTFRTWCDTKNKNAKPGKVSPYCSGYLAPGTIW